MTPPATARLAGATFLLYIAAGVAGMTGLAAPLAGIVLSLTMSMSALVLASTLYALTRETDADLARLAMLCRTAEAVLGVAYMPVRLALRSMTAAATADGPALQTLSTLFSKARAYNTTLGATFFAAGSLIFCWLLLRGRVVPAALAWIGIAASLLLLLVLPRQLAGATASPLDTYAWLPMLVFEVGAAFWLLIKGVPTHGTRPPAISPASARSSS
jgi:hypothetical protein